MRRITITPYFFAVDPRWQLVPACLTLSMAFMIGPVVAAQTAPPIPIHGRAPTASGTVSIRMPDGTTALVDNATVLGTKKPNEFTLAPLSPGVTFTDVDGDKPGAPDLAIAPSGVVWTWMNGSTPLTAAQLNQTFATNFANGTVLTVQATAPVLSTSLTGIPTTSGTPIAFATSTYRVKVNIPAKPVIRVNGTTFAWDSGFPTTGFVGAKFQLYMNGVNATANSNYTYTENGNQTWVDIPASNASGNEGAFTFTGTPTSANKTLKIIATNKADSNDKHTLSITLGRWFVNGGATSRSASGSDAYCTGLGGGYSTPPYTALSSSPLNNYGPRAATGGLWSQWGDMSKYNTGWLPGYVWASEGSGSNRHAVYMENGIIHLYPSYMSGVNTGCSRSL